MVSEEVLSVRGKEVRIRLMDEDHLVSCCWGHREEPNHTGKAFEQWHREIMKRYGNTGAVALSEGKVVGFVNFWPGSLPIARPSSGPTGTSPDVSLCPCVDAEIAALLERIDWPRESGEALSLGCVNLAPSVRRAGVGSALVRAAVEWARQNNYRSVLAGANDTAWWIPCRPFWEKLGFRVKETIEFDKPREDGEMREYVMELILR